MPLRSSKHVSPRAALAVVLAWIAACAADPGDPPKETAGDSSSPPEADEGPPEETGPVVVDSSVPVETSTPMDTSMVPETAPPDDSPVSEEAAPPPVGCATGA